jgi:hypothetical protein
VDLYRFIVRDMVRGAWKEKVRSDDDPHVSLMARLLRQLAWSLFRVNPARTLFSDDEWIDEVVKACKELNLQWSTEEVLTELRATGLLVSPASGQRRLLHRTLLEFLAAEYIAQQADPLIHIEPFLWQPDKDGILRWQPAAAEMICFLAGCLVDPNPLLRRLVQLDEEQRDQFRTMLLLAGQVLADVDETGLDDPLAQTITDEVFRLWCYWSVSSLVPHVDDITRSLFHRRGEAVLMAARTNGQLRERVEFTLGAFKSRQVVEIFIKQMQSDSDEHLRWRAAYVLGVIGDEQAVEPLIERMQNDTDALVRRGAAIALAEIGNERAVESLIDRLQNDNDAVLCRLVSEALAKLGGEQALETVE